MKEGVRALGIAESFRERVSTIAGVVIRRDWVVDGVSFNSCTVGGTDATDALTGLLEDVYRPDVNYVLLGTVAPAWYNIVDLERVHTSVSCPVIAVTFEESDGLEEGLRGAFNGAALETRLERYRSLPPRHPVSIGDDTVFVRSLGCDLSAATTVVRAFTRDGGRPEPIRVARLAARAGDAYRHAETK